MKEKLSKKDFIFVDEAENAKDYLAYKNVSLYASTDIPLTDAKTRYDHLALGKNSCSSVITPTELWKDFDPNGDPLETYVLSEEENRKDYSFCALHASDGNVYTQISVFHPSYASKKAVLLIGDKCVPSQQGVLDAIVQTGAYVFICDYNALMPGTATVFPQSFSYGKRGSEGTHDGKEEHDPKATCAYLYALIHRRALAFIREEYGLREVIVVGIKSGTEIAMTVAGMEKETVIALGCLCGAGYVEYKDIARFPVSHHVFDDETLSYIISCSGVSYLRDYPHPVFTALGSNGTESNIDRLSALKSLILGTLTIEISPQSADNIDANVFRTFLTWLDYSFWKSSFPDPPVTTLDINRDRTVYADVKANVILPIKGATLNYSYGNNNHVTRRWQSVTCETIGVGQFLAKLSFSKPCDYLFYYTEITYVNGLTVTEAPKFADLSDYRIAVDPAKPTAVLFRYGAEGTFHEVSENAVILSKMIEDSAVPSGAKGVVCAEGSMCLFLGDSCSSIESDKILQVDCYSDEDNYPLELVISIGTPAVEYRARKVLRKNINFSGIKFSLSDFKDDRFRSPSEWKYVNTITVVSKNILINKLTFI